MTATTKVLKRKDAASVVVAVIIAMVVWQILPSLTSELAGTLSGVESLSVNVGWQELYLQPVVAALLQLLLLELLIQLYVAIRSALVKK